MSDKATLSDSDCPTLREALVSDWSGNIFISMVLVYDQDILGNEDIALQMDSILGVNLRPPVNHTIIVDYDDRLAFLLRRNAQPQASILLNEYVLAKLNAVRNSPINGARRMNRDA